MTKRMWWLSISRYLLLLAAALWLLAGCRSNFADMTYNLQPHSLQLPRGWYGPSAWLTADQIAFEYQPSYDAPLQTTRIVIYSISTGTSQELPTLPNPPDCFSSWFRSLGRLPDGNLGLILQCALKPSGDQQALYVWDMKSEIYQVLQRYPSHDFAASEFSFAPDMSALIQESMIGPRMNNQLYWVTSEGERERLVPNFQRAMGPTWSSDGHTIAFFGTEKYPGGNSKDFTTFDQITNLVLYPWDVYFMDAASREVRLVLPAIKDPGYLKWSPDGRLLALSGVYRDTPGIWLYDPGTDKMTRLWMTRDAFDWSPDGHQMVISISGSEKTANGITSKYTTPLIIDVPIISP